MIHVYVHLHSLYLILHGLLQQKWVYNSVQFTGGYICIGYYAVLLTMLLRMPTIHTSKCKCKTHKSAIVCVLTNNHIQRAKKKICLSHNYETVLHTSVGSGGCMLEKYISLRTSKEVRDEEDSESVCERGRCV